MIINKAPIIEIIILHFISKIITLLTATAQLYKITRL